jgi:hypothetical protein
VIAQFHYLPVAFAVFWKSGLALGAALGMNWLLRKKSADVRRLVLSTAVAAMLVAAVALPVLPRWTAVMPRWFQAQRPAAQAVREQASGLSVTDDRELTARNTQSLAAHPAVRRIDLRHWLAPPDLVRGGSGAIGAICDQFVWTSPVANGVGSAG